jgi:hypothetical protein
MSVRDLDPTGWRITAYWSNDGGLHWKEAQLPLRDGVGCAADPWLVWGRGHNVYFTCLAPVPTPDKSDFNFRIWLYTSRDGGRSWKAPVELQTNPVGEWDHPVLVLAPRPDDATSDALSVVGVRPRRAGNGFGLARHGEAQGGFAAALWYDPPERRNDILGSAVYIDRERVLLTYFAMLGEPPRPFYATLFEKAATRRTVISENIVPLGFPMLAVDRSKATHPILLATWLEQTEPNNLDVMLGRSNDTGRTWVSVPLTAGQPSRHRARPNIAVGRRGLVAVTWFETVDNSPCGEILVTVAESPTAKFKTVSRESTTSAACSSSLEPELLSVLNRWRSGGDYSGISASAVGIVDVTWADVREDGLQIRFARLRIP